MRAPPPISLIGRLPSAGRTERRLAQRRWAVAQVAARHRAIAPGRLGEIKRTVRFGDQDRLVMDLLEKLAAGGF